MMPFTLLFRERYKTTDKLLVVEGKSPVRHSAIDIVITARTSNLMNITASPVLVYNKAMEVSILLYAIVD